MWTHLPYKFSFCSNPQLRTEWVEPGTPYNLTFLTFPRLDIHSFPIANDPNFHNLEHKKISQQCLKPLKLAPNKSRSISMDYSSCGGHKLTITSLIGVNRLLLVWHTVMEIELWTWTYARSGIWIVGEYCDEHVSASDSWSSSDSESLCSSSAIPLNLMNCFFFPSIQSCCLLYVPCFHEVCRNSGKGGMPSTLCPLQDPPLNQSVISEVCNELVS